MMLREETTVATSALPLVEFRDHLRLGTGFGDVGAEDVALEAYLRAAMAAIEGRTAKALLARDFVLSVEAWRDGAVQVLPVAPVIAVLEAQLVDRAGAITVIEAARYRLIEDMQRPRVKPVAGVLPAVPTGGVVRIGFRAGYGARWDSLPADLGQAVLLLAAYYYEYRNETSVGEGYMPFGVSSLIERYRTVRLFAGSGQ